jgi:hypothetical protein
MHDLAFPIETLKREHEERLRRIQQDQLIRQLAGRSKPADYMLKTLGNLLIVAGQRLHAYAGEAARPFDQADPGVAR